MTEPVATGAGELIGRGAAGASVALLVVDDELRVAEASLAACRLLGTAREDVVDHPLGELLSPLAADRLEGVWQVFQENGGHAGPFELGWADARAPIDISITAEVLPGRHLLLLSPSNVAPPPRREQADGRSGVRGPTSRERQILALLAGGDTDVQIAAKLDLSPATVQTHVRNAKAKLGARTRAQAVAMALRDRLIGD